MQQTREASERNRRRWTFIKRNLLILTSLMALSTTHASAQVCSVPDRVRSNVPTDAYPELPYETQRITGSEGASVPLGIGHLHYSDANPVLDLPPGAGDWLGEVALPISATAGVAPTVWIIEGWILQEGFASRPLSRTALVETGYEEASFVVLESRPDGWFRVRYDVGTTNEGTGWTPACALSNGAVLLEFTNWGDWLLDRSLSGGISPLFYRSGVPGALYGDPSVDSERLRDIGHDYILHPIELDGDWMRVMVKEPSDYCEFDLESASRDGWVQWSTEENGPLVWYFTRGC